jgi:peptidoglycan DL-endopeptidase CwlO
MVSVRKIATCMLIGSLAFAGHTETAKAAETPVAGIDLILSDLNFSSQTLNLGMETVLLSKTKEQETDLAFAKVDNYVNIRSKADEESKILGKLYKDSSATILKKEGDWYQVKSGSVTGYIKGDFLITGKEAEDYGKKVGTTLATINTTTLRVREKASEKSAVLTLVPIGDDYKVTKEKGDWVKISIDASTSGYVSKDYVKLKKVYSEAISIEEEQAQLAAEADAAVRKLSVADSSSNTKKTYAKSNTVKAEVKRSTASEVKSEQKSSSSNSSVRNQIADYALKFEGNPYKWGGTSLTRGADCSGFTQSVLAHFGIYVPRTSRQQASSGRRVDLDDIRPGDLIFYRKNGTINHVALYIGNGKVIGAKSKSEGIRITNYNYRTPYKAVTYIN